MRRYRENFDLEMLRPWRASNREALFSEISKSHIVLLADFHALAQSQRAQLRILKGLDLPEKCVLMLECFSAEDQGWLDRYMSGDISERQLLQKVEWSKSWGFPWEHYRPLLRFAQKHKIPVYGLNKSQGKRGLSDRDRFAADEIMSAYRKHPDSKLVVVFGDLHLASSHLPRAILKQKTRKENLRILRVFQNSERIFLRLLEREQEMNIDVVRFSKDEFCLMSVAPWVKWQNYVLFLERHLDRELRGESPEYTDHIERYLKVIASDLGVVVPEGGFSIYTPDDASFWDLLQTRLEGTRLKNLKDLIRDSKSFFVPELAAGYLSRPSVNQAAQLATSIFHAHVSGWRENPRPRGEDFLRSIWMEAVQYFGSKLINPKRKTDTIQDIRVLLASRNPTDLGEEALKLALNQKMLEMLFLTGARAQSSSFRPRKSSSYPEAARLLGGLLGEKLFTGLRKRVIGPAAVLRLLKYPVDDPGFSKFYFELLEIVEGLPEPFLSKTDKM